MIRLSAHKTGIMEDAEHRESRKPAMPLSSSTVEAVKMPKSQYSGSLSEQEDVFAVAGTMATADLPPFPINFDEVPF